MAYQCHRRSGFQESIRYLDPGYCVPSHTHIATVCHHLYNVQKERLMKEIADCSHVALTTDIGQAAL